jgi:uncharacterized protein (DUF169 family)
MTITGSASLGRLGLRRSPVAVGFLDTPPADLPRIERAAPAGCEYWALASEGAAFYTTAEDHQNCPVGALTHGVDLLPSTAEELRSLVGTMIELKYLAPDDVEQMPRRRASFRVAAYAPLDRATFPADVAIFRGNARQIMILSEAARAAGAFEPGAVMGRPACAMLPQVIASGAAAASLGCIGNRVYTGLGDDELYLAVPAAKVGAMLTQLESLLDANLELERYHRQRRSERGG